MAGFNKIKVSERALEQRIRKARRVLGLPIKGTYTKKEILEWYKTIVMETHPDILKHLKTQPANYTFNDIRKAKDFLIKQLEEKR